MTGESMSSAVSSANKQFIERRNVFFRAWFVKVQGQRWCHGSHKMCGASWGKVQRGTRTWLPCLWDTLAV